jgi:UDP-N-acetylglucosamine:LPS N-acetylglucosamine transferase
VNRPRIVFATIAAGGGHVTPAHAMAEAVALVAPEAFEITVTDLMHDLGWRELDRRHKEQWRWMLAHPWTIRVGQRVIDAVPRLTRAILRRSLDAFARAAAEHFIETGPALIVANHGFLAVALTRARRRYGLRAPVLIFTTELFDANALWAEPGAERYAAPSPEARDDLVRLGVDAARIDVVGYPVRQAFLRPRPKAAARAALGLDDRFTCLVTLGGEGVAGDAVRVAETLLAMQFPPQVVVLAGRNAALAHMLRTRPRAGLVIRDFVDSVADHVAAADVVIGKAGPNSVLEAVAVGRPVVVTRSAGLNEDRVLRFLEANGLGHDARGAGALERWVARYRDEPTVREAFDAAAARLDVAGTTRRVGEHVVGIARSGEGGAARRTAGPA